MKTCFLLFISAVFCLFIHVSADERISLNGSWDFAIDPLEEGLIDQWQEPWEYQKKSDYGHHQEWDSVVVPHCFTVDNIFAGYQGDVWYRKVFQLDSDLMAKHYRLRFEGVFYQTSVWLNGVYLGDHEGGYTPFEFDLTETLKSGANFLVVKVNNKWNGKTLPGARYGKDPVHQVYPWLEYGGLIREVAILQTEKCYVEKQKIDAKPNLKNGRATIEVKTWFNNESNVGQDIEAEFAVLCDGEVLKTKSVTFHIDAEMVKNLTQIFELGAGDVNLWHFDHPHLYQLTTHVGKPELKNEVHQEHFGIRDIKTADGKLFLNGEPIRLGGANRHADHPVFGSIGDPGMLDKDLTLLKEAGLELARLSHNPTSTYLLDWCDKNGILIIAEGGNWQIPPHLMGDSWMQAKYQIQMREMIERDWNHPCIIAWSVGNEYESWTEQGDEWTGKMIEYGKSLDDSRLYTFAALGSSLTAKRLTPAHDGYRFCDFLCINYYGAAENFGSKVDLLHQKYPNQAVFLTEYGKRADQVSEEERIDHFNGIIRAVNERLYMVGASWWSFNDYRSRYKGTNPQGYRGWGLIDHNREKRGLYTVMQKRFSPMVLEVKDGKLNIRMRQEFPSYTARNFSVIFSNGERVSLESMKPGEQTTISIPSGCLSVTIEKPGGFKVIDQLL